MQKFYLYEFSHFVGINYPDSVLPRFVCEIMAESNFEAREIALKMFHQKKFYYTASSVNDSHILSEGDCSNAIAVVTNTKYH